MKKIGFKMFWWLLIGLLLSCATPTPSPTTSNPFRPLSGFPNADVIGTVQTDFDSQFHPSDGGLNSELAYLALMEAARQEYSGNIDIVDISFVFIRTRGTRFHYSALGKVVTIGGGNRRTSTASGVEGALERAAENVAENFTARSRIAIVYITAQDRSTTEYITGELEHILRGRGFVIVDRSELDRIRREQNFQMSGEVDDATAISLGRFSGANIIVTGRVDGEDNLRRLRLRALDTTSGQVVGTASERL